MNFAELLSVFVISLLIVGATLAAMAVGVMFRRPCLRGSCGGAPALGRRGEQLSCADCPNRRRRPQDAAQAAPPDD
jgi:hypothetical protein